MRFFAFFAVNLFQQTPARLRRAPPLKRGLFIFAASRLRVSQPVAVPATLRSRLKAAHQRPIFRAFRIFRAFSWLKVLFFRG